MEDNDLEKYLSKIENLVEDPRFYGEAFNLVCQKRKEKLDLVSDNFEKIAADEFVEQSQQIDKSTIQESTTVRNNLKTRRLAKILISDKGEINLSIIPSVIKFFEASNYSLGPNRQYDAIRNERIIKVLKALLENKQVVHKLKVLSRPFMHPFADQIIRDTLNLPTNTIIKDAHAKRAALSALLCYLRQNVGSCFATAPAIIVHQEQMEVFLQDIQELLSTGRLKRIYGGVEYVVPLSYSWGSGDLRRQFLFQRSELQEDILIWHAPAFIRAFEKIKLIDQDISLEDKIERSKELIVNVLKNWNSKSDWFLASLEGVLKNIILSSLDLTNVDIFEWELKPKEIIRTGGILMEYSKTAAGKDNIDLRCKSFVDKFEESKKAFISLSDNALLKSWEFTVASFAETKANFTKWNLYSSLGLKPTDKGGIGPGLYEILKRRLDESNQKSQEYQQEYEVAWSRLQFVQARAKSVSSEKDAAWVRTEYQMRLSEFNTMEELRNKFHNKARRYANLYDGLIDLYFRIFPTYFQEIYDSDIQETTPGPFDDSPAGFRLLYKYGRENTSQWTRITNPGEFIDALSNFFIVTENELSKSPEMKGLEDDLAEIITAIVSHVRSYEFLETAIYRMAIAHKAPIIKNPLENLDKVEKKPWVYTSGGAITTLVSCYFRLSEKPRDVSRWVENPMELLIFLIDSVKEMPVNMLDEFEKNSEKSLLMHSPTHAFLLKPGYFKEAWKSKIFTYTWVRDYVYQPMDNFCSKIYLDDEKMQFVFDYLNKFVPVNFKHYFKNTFSNIGGSMRGVDLRNHIIDTIDLTRGLQYASRGVISKEDVDSSLYSLLPLFPSYQLIERVQTILEELPDLSKNERSKIINAIDENSRRFGSPKIISATHLQNIVKAFIAMVKMKTSSDVDYPLLIARACQKLGFAMPAPFIFADSNWVKDYFAFVVNPGTLDFELWRVDYTGAIGHPMHDWKIWLDGSKKEPDWGVFNRPNEYVY